jgi:hypothetical protein
MILARLDRPPRELLAEAPPASDDTVAQGDQFAQETSPHHRLLFRSTVDPTRGYDHIKPHGKAPSSASE